MSDTPPPAPPAPRPFDCERCHLPVGHLVRVGRVDWLECVVKLASGICFTTRIMRGSVTCPHCAREIEYYPGAASWRVISKAIEAPA